MKTNEDKLSKLSEDKPTIHRRLFPKRKDIEVINLLWSCLETEDPKILRERLSAAICSKKLRNGDRISISLSDVFNIWRYAFPKNNLRTKRPNPEEERVRVLKEESELIRKDKQQIEKKLESLRRQQADLKEKILELERKGEDVSAIHEKKRALLSKQGSLWKKEDSLWDRNNEIINELEASRPQLPSPYSEFLALPYRLDFEASTEEGRILETVDLLLKVRPVWKSFNGMIKDLLTTKVSPILTEIKEFYPHLSKSIVKVVETYNQKLNEAGDQAIEALNHDFDLQLSDIMGEDNYINVWLKHCLPYGRKALIEKLGNNWKNNIIIEHDLMLPEDRTIGKIRIDTLEKRIKCYMNDEQSMFLRYLRDFPLDTFAICNGDYCKKVFIRTRLGRLYCSKNCRQNNSYLNRKTRG